MRLPAILLLTLSMALLTACGNDSSSTPTPPPTPSPSAESSPPPAPSTPPAPTSSGRPQIAIIPHTVATESDQALHAGAVKAIMEAKKGADGKPIIDLLWKPPEDKPEAQLQLQQSLLKRGVAVLIVAPDDQSTLNAITATAIAAHVPVLAIDSTLHTDACRAAISSDDQKIGELAARQLLATIEPEKIHLLALSDPQDPASVAREKAFRDVIETRNKTSFPKVDLIAPELSAESFQHLAKSSANGIFAPDERTTLRAIQALADAHLGGKIKLVGVGNSPKLAAALQSGELSALILTDPLATGYQAVKTAIDCIKEKKVEKHIDIPLHVATRENLADPEIAASLHPPIDQYLSK